MPSYITSPQPIQLHALYAGNSIALVNNAATDSGITQTIQTCIPPDPSGNDTLTLVNTTNQTATVAISAADSAGAGSYEPLKNADTGNAITVAAATTITFRCRGPWLSCTFSVAPTSGSLILSR